MRLILLLIPYLALGALAVAAPEPAAGQPGAVPGVPAVAEGR